MCVRVRSEISIDLCGRRKRENLNFISIGTAIGTVRELGSTKGERFMLTGLILAINRL